MDLKIKDVADLLDVSETTIRRWLSLGKIPAYRLNGQYRFSRQEIESWLMQCKTHKEQTSSLAKGLEQTLHSIGLNKFCLYRALHKGMVLQDMGGDNKQEVITSSVRVIAEHLALDADVLTDLLLDREQMMPTGLNHGIGVPHTRDFLLNRPFDVVTVVYPKEPIAYGSLDGIDVHTLFFLFASDDKRHLQLLAKIAHLVSSSDAKEFLASRPSKEMLLEYVKNWESGIPMPQQEKTSLNQRVSS